PRECYRRVALFKSADYIPNLEGGVAKKTLKRWHREGLPEGVSRNEFFGLDRVELMRDISYSPIPGVADRTSDLPMTRYGRAFRDAWGRVAIWHPYKDDDEYAESGHMVLRGALQGRGDWEEIRGHFRPDVETRYPDDWPERVERWRKREHVLVLEAPSMIGSLRMEMGFENYCIKLHDDRPMVEELLDARTDLALQILGKAADEVDFDMLWFWEDCAFRNGPILSPAVFEQIAVPRYQRLARWWRSRGGQIVAVDSDGDVRELIPGWLEAGINHIWPLEPFAGMDVVALREQYGQAFSMRGGIDKHVVARGREAIDRELDRVCPVVRDGGYMPHLDHQIPDCPFEDYCYYMERKHELLGTRPNYARYNGDD
ncbi:MAG: uroporphyrinogen decarboxylase family protein, partial [Candidatus Brocadiaceae bacterium]